MAEQGPAPLHQHHGHGGQGQGQQGIGGGPPGQNHLKGQHRDLAQQEHQHPGAGRYGPHDDLHEPGEQHEGRGGDHDPPQGFSAQKSAHHHPGPGKERIHARELRRRHGSQAEGGAAFPHPHPAEDQAPREGGQLQKMFRCVRSLFLAIHGPIVDDGRGPFSANPARAYAILPDRIGRASASCAPFPAFLCPPAMKTLSCPGGPDMVYLLSNRIRQKGLL